MRPPNVASNASNRLSSARATRPLTEESSLRQRPHIGIAQPLRQQDHNVPMNSDWRQKAEAARLTKQFQIRSAVTEAERGAPSIIDSSPTIAPGPRMARMRSPPLGAATLALSNPSSIR